MQLVVFPALGSQPAQLWRRAEAMLRSLPSGVSAVALRKALREHQVADEPGALSAWCGLLWAGTQHTLAEVVQGLQASKGYGEWLANHLWQCNPYLANALLGLLQERPHSRDELYKALTSGLYRGRQLTRPEFEHWLVWLQLASVVRPLGIAFVLAQHGELWQERQGAFSPETFLEAEAANESPAKGEREPMGDIAVSTPLVADISGRVRSSVRDEGVGGGPLVGVPAAVLALAGASDPTARASNGPDTTADVRAWFAQAQPAWTRLGPADAKLADGAWQDDAPDLLFRLALLAGVAFRQPGGRAEALTTFTAMQESGLLDALRENQLPASIPPELDSRAVMLASVLRGRLESAPELAEKLTSAASLAVAVEHVDAVLGRGLFVYEQFWLLDALSDLGILRFDGASSGVAVPFRGVRDVLMRLGASAHCYAPDMSGLVAASEVASAFGVERARGDVVLLAFAMAAGCQFQCCHRLSCQVSCRERHELGG